MGKNVRITGLKDFEKRFNVEKWSDCCGKLTERLARGLGERSAEATPVVTGTLRSGWEIIPVQKAGKRYESGAKNETDYASYVEYGHWQEAGRFVPAIGRRLTAERVRGRYMMTRAAQDFLGEIPKIVEEEMRDFFGK